MTGQLGLFIILLVPVLTFVAGGLLFSRYSVKERQPKATNKSTQSFSLHNYSHHS